MLNVYLVHMYRVIYMCQMYMYLLCVTKLICLVQRPKTGSCGPIPPTPYVSSVTCSLRFACITNAGGFT